MKKLLITNCCADHACDNCKICASGRCCRTDNPNYKLPKLGDWEGTVYGELGVFNNDVGGLAECHCCGKLFGHLGLHVWNAHDLTADEYRAIFGLRQATGLTGANLLEKRRQNVSHLKEFRDIAAATLRSLTPEQRKYNIKDRGYRLERKKNPDYLPQKMEALEKARIIRKRKLAETAVFFTCDICGKEFKKRSGQEKFERHYCSSACYKKCPLRSERGKTAFENNLKNRPRKSLKHKVRN